MSKVTPDSPRPDVSGGGYRAEGAADIVVDNPVKQSPQPAANFAPAGAMTGVAAKRSTAKRDAAADFLYRFVHDR